jgi:hypothetical protein
MTRTRAALRDQCSAPRSRPRVRLVVEQNEQASPTPGPDPRGRSSAIADVTQLNEIWCYEAEPRP